MRYVSVEEATFFVGDLAVPVPVRVEAFTTENVPFTVIRADAVDRLTLGGRINEDAMLECYSESIVKQLDPGASIEFNLRPAPTRRMTAAQLVVGVIRDPS